MKIVLGAINTVQTAIGQMQDGKTANVQLAKDHTALGVPATIKKIPQGAASVRDASVDRVRRLFDKIGDKVADRMRSAERLFSPAHDAAQETRLSTARANLRGELGHAGAGSILNQRIATLDHPGGVGIDTLMEAYHDKLTNVAGATHSFTAASKDEMKTWVAMGEKIMAAIADWDGEGPLEFTLPNGVSREIPANLDTIRAVSWYLQAQAMLDNATDKRPATELGGGTMILKDDGNKLYKFFASSDNVYGRFSSHFKHGRAESGTALAPASSRQGVTAPALGWVMGQSLQNGIEDLPTSSPRTAARCCSKG